MANRKVRKIIERDNRYGYLAQGEEEFVSLTNFKMEITLVVENPDSGQTGFIAEVTRNDGKTGTGYIRSEDLRDISTVTEALSKSCGGGLLYSNVSRAELFALMDQLNGSLLLKSRETGLPYSRRLVQVAGLQPSNHYVMNPDQAFCLESGNMIEEKDKKDIWITSWPGSPGLQCARFVQTPLGQNSMALFVDGIMKTCQENAVPTLLATVDMLEKHLYQKVMTLNNHCNMTLLYGQPHCGKTLAASCAALVCGKEGSLFYRRCTTVGLHNLITSQTTPFVWDDPDDKVQVGQVAVDIHNGAVRLKGSQEPRAIRTAPLVTANFALTEDPRFHTRFIMLPFTKLVDPVYGEDKKLMELASKASSALPGIISMLNTIEGEELSDWVTDLQKLMPGVELRVVDSIALLLLGAHKILEGCGRLAVFPEVEKYVQNIICPLYNTQEKRADTDEDLQALINNLSGMETDQLNTCVSLVGQGTLAFRHKGVAGLTGQKEETVKNLLLSRGATARGQARFGTTGRKKSQKCLLLPLSVLDPTCSKGLLSALEPGTRQEDAAHDPAPPVDNETDETAAMVHVDGDNHTEQTAAMVHVDGDNHTEQTAAMVHVDGDNHTEQTAAMVHVDGDNHTEQTAAMVHVDGDNETDETAEVQRDDLGSEPDITRENKKRNGDGPKEQRNKKRKQDTADEPRRGQRKRIPKIRQ